MRSSPTALLRTITDHDCTPTGKSFDPLNSGSVTHGTWVLVHSTQCEALPVEFKPIRASLTATGCFGRVIRVAFPTGIGVERPDK